MRAGWGVVLEMCDAVVLEMCDVRAVEFAEGSSFRLRRGGCKCVSRGSTLLFSALRRGSPVGSSESVGAGGVADAIDGRARAREGDRVEEVALGWMGYW